MLLSAENIETIDRVQKEVGEWSRANFGEQVSRHNGACLGSTAPLLGIGEEIGELLAANTTDDRKDAIGDIMVYLCDWAARDGVSLADVVSEPRDAYHATGLTDVMVGFGQMCHATLKRHQGIRGFDDRKVYQKAIAKAVRLLFNGLDSYSRLNCSGCAAVQLSTTWTKVVAKRDWKKNPGQGA